MAITLRTLKGTALTYEEVDRNFSQYFYSASYDGAKIYLWCTGSSNLNLPGENYSPRVGAEFPFVTTTGGGGGGGTSGGTSDGNIQYKVGTGFGGDDRFHYDSVSGYVGLGTKTPGAHLNVTSTAGVAGKIRLTAIDAVTTDGGKTSLDFFKSNRQVGEIGFATANSSVLSINSTSTGTTPELLAGIKFGIAGSTKGYLTSTGFVISSAGLAAEVPNQTLAVIGTIGVGGDLSNNQSIIRSQAGISVSVLPTTLLPASAAGSGLLIESPKGLGGNVVIGLNSTVNNNEAFSIIRGLAGTYTATLATFKADGNVGIGIATPVTKLQVSGSYSTNSGLINTSTRPVIAAGTLPSGELRGYSNNGTAMDDGFLRISAGGGTNANQKAFIDLSGFSNISDMLSNITLGTSGVERIRINSSGNVGIGTTEPGTYRLNVNGTTNIAGALTVGGATTIGGTTTITGNTTINGTLTIAGETTVVTNSTSTGTYSAKNITGLAMNGAVAANWFTNGGIVVAGNTANSTVPVLGFSQQGTSIFGSSIHLLSNGEFRFLRQDGTTLANISATTITATTLNGNHVGTWNGLNYSNANSINTIVQRDSSGYINAEYFRTTGALLPNTSGLNLFAGFLSADGLIKGFTAQAAADALSGKTMNILGSARSILLGSNSTISNLNIVTSGEAAVRFDSFVTTALNKPDTVDNANGVITFTTNHGTQYGKQIAFVDSDDLWIRNLQAGNYQTWRKVIHSGNYATLMLPLVGGTMTGDILFAQPPTVTTKRGIRGTMGDNDYWFVGGGATGTDAGFLELATGDNGAGTPFAEPIYASQYDNGLFNTIPIRRAALLDENGNTSFPGNLGIGTTTPGAFRLNVNGTSNLGGDTNIAGDLTFSGNAAQRAARRYTSSIVINNTTFTNLCTISGINASAVKMSIKGSIGNVIIPVTVDILVNHSLDIFIQSTAGIYTLLTLRVAVDLGSTFSVEAKYTSPTYTATTPCTVAVEVFPQSSETVVFSGPIQTSRTLEHECIPGINISATDDASTNAGNLKANGNITAGTLFTTNTATGTANNTSALVTTATGEVKKIDAAPVPKGGIIMWSGAITNIPTGWFLCNGSNGTPNLVDKFIIGAGTDSAGQSQTNVTGGQTKTGGFKDSVVVSHTHPIRTGNQGIGKYGPMVYFGQGTQQAGSLGGGGGQVWTDTISADTVGVSGTNQNLPPYYALAYIMYGGIV